MDDIIAYYDPATYMYTYTRGGRSFNLPAEVLATRELPSNIRITSDMLTDNDPQDITEVVADLRRDALIDYDEVLSNSAIFSPVEETTAPEEDMITVRRIDGETWQVPLPVPELTEMTYGVRASTVTPYSIRVTDETYDFGNSNGSVSIPVDSISSISATTETGGIWGPTKTTITIESYAYATATVNSVEQENPVMTRERDYLRGYLDGERI